MPGTIGGGSLHYYWEILKNGFRKLIFGNPLATSVQLEHRLPILLALPVFASDALSSVAYATEEILIQFEHAHFDPTSPAVLQALLYVSIAIAVLVLIVGFSYRQAIHLYPSGGGSYSVSRDNLGVWPGLVAAAALTVDYILTVAVSVSSGVAQVASFPFFKNLHDEFGFAGMKLPYTVLMALLIVAIIMLMNLRGTRESGWVFAAPAYLFIVFLGIAIITTVIRYFTGHVVVLANEEVTNTAVRNLGPIGLLLVLRAFASGCSALTGVEAVSNGVSAFEPPEARNASKTLGILMVMLITLFLGVSWAAHLYHAVPTATQTVIFRLASAAFTGIPVLGGFLTGALIIITLLVLMIAANTSFAGLPRLLALVAKDGYAPKTFINLGDRLVHTSGILMLSLISSLLIIGFKAETSKLIPLYAVGVFICFTLSQAGMVKKVLDLKEQGWQRMVAINAIGGLVTLVVAVIQAVTKFTEGAWMVVLVMPILVIIFWVIHRHYQWFDETMTVHPYDFNPLSEPAEPLTVLVLVSSDVHRGILEGLECGRAIAENHPGAVLRAIHIEMDPEKTPRLKAKWDQYVEPFLGGKIKLDIVPSPYRWLIEPIMDYLDWTDLERANDRIIVVLPEFETGSWITQLLHNFTARRLRTALLNRPHVTVVSSRYFMKPMAWRLGRGGLVY